MEYTIDTYSHSNQETDIFLQKDHKYKTVLVGLGDIARHHHLGLESCASLELLAVCDIKDNAPSRSYYKEKRFYSDIAEMLEKEEPQMVILATPPSTHCTLTEICAKHNALTLVEKPLATTMKDVTQMIELLTEKRCNIIYHWIFSQEILWFQRNAKVKDVQRIHFQMEDSYMDLNGHVLPNRRFLGGCWIDSGVNALSVLSLWFDLANLQLQEYKVIKDGAIPVETHAAFTVDKAEVIMDISWRTGRNYKKTTLQIGNNEYVLEHSLQKVLCNGKEIFSDQTMERLDRHYYNFYSLFPTSFISLTTTKKIHEILMNIY